MHTDCTPIELAFEGLGRRAVVGRFDGGRLTTDGGVLLLREVDRRFRVTSRLAACFRDHRDPRRIEHRLETLVAQRVLALAAGYEDLNDHDRLETITGRASWLPYAERAMDDRNIRERREWPDIWPGPNIPVNRHYYCWKRSFAWCTTNGMARSPSRVAVCHASRANTNARINRNVPSREWRASRPAATRMLPFSWPPVRQRSLSDDCPCEADRKLRSDHGARIASAVATESPFRACSWLGARPLGGTGRRFREPRPG